MHVSPKSLLGLLFLAFGVGILLPSFTATGWVVGTTPTLETIPYSSASLAFCPSPTCVTIPISALNAAQSHIEVAMYSFTHPDLAQALMDAHARGVNVRVLVESQQAAGTYSIHQTLLDAGIPVRVDSNPSYMHHKFAIIDDAYLISGSMNWSRNGVGENNENVLVIHSPELNAQFAQEFEKLWSKGRNP